MPGWRDVVRLPDEERRPAAASTAVRGASDGVAEAAQGGLAAMANFDLIEMAEGRPSRVARSQTSPRSRREPAAVLVDVVFPTGAPDAVLPSLVPSLGGHVRAGWSGPRYRRDPRVMLGGSDAGAHLDIMCHGNYPTVVSGTRCASRWIELEDGRAPYERRPARLYGLRGRGRIEQGWHGRRRGVRPGTRSRASRHASCTTCPEQANGCTRARPASSRVIVGGRDVVVDGTFTGERGNVAAIRPRHRTVTVPGGRGVSGPSRFRPARAVWCREPRSAHPDSRRSATMPAQCRTAAARPSTRCARNRAPRSRPRLAATRRRAHR